MFGRRRPSGVLDEAWPEREADEWPDSRLRSMSTNWRNPRSRLDTGGLAVAVAAGAMLEPMTTTGFSSLLSSSLNSWNLKWEWNLM